MQRSTRRAIIMLMALGSITVAVASAQSYDLTGYWQDENGVVTSIRQIGNNVYWYADGRPRVHNVYYGIVAGDIVTGAWADLPGGELQNGGTLGLRIESANRFVKISSSIPYGASVWNRVGGPTVSGATGGAFSLIGTWRWQCCVGRPYSGPLRITSQAPDGSFTGDMANEGGGYPGSVQGRIQGNQVVFDEVGSWGTARYTGIVTRGANGMLQIQGSWTGWSAEGFSDRSFTAQQTSR